MPIIRDKSIKRICECGCEQVFYPFRFTYDKDKNPIYPLYKRGHHPNTKKSLNKFAGWNKGLNKESHPSISRMGFQKGHKPLNDWSKVHKRLKSDKSFRKRWIQSKKGKTPWNKGKTKKDYENGIKSGKDHGNWCGGSRGINDTAKMKSLKKDILNRDKYTCQNCGDHNHKGRGSRIRLEVHHIVAISHNHQLAFDPSNCITLCHSCHIKTDNYGTKSIHQRRKKSGN